MRVSSSAVSLTVDDVPASSKFLATHFGFVERMSPDGFVSLGRDDAGMDVVFLRRGIEVLPEPLRDRTAAGVIVAFVVDNLEATAAELQAKGVEQAYPFSDVPDGSGDRWCFIRDNEGMLVELYQPAG